MYFFYLDNILLPVAPSKLQLKIKNNNKTINLINEGEVNVIKDAGLTEVNFEALLPQVDYPFSVYKDGVYRGANYYLDHLEKLKIEKKPFQFIVDRFKTRGVMLFSTNLKVTLEDYTIEEDSKNGIDFVVNIKLKQYREYGTKVVKIKKTKGKTKAKTKSTRASSKKIPSTYKVKKGDTMWKIAKKLLGDGSKCWNLARYNGLKTPNSIHIGQVLKIKDVKASNDSYGTPAKRTTKSGKATRSTLPSQDTNKATTPSTPTTKPATLADVDILSKVFAYSVGNSSNKIPVKKKPATGMSGYSFVKKFNLKAKKPAVLIPTTPRRK